MKHHNQAEYQRKKKKDDDTNRIRQREEIVSLFFFSLPGTYPPFPISYSYRHISLCVRRAVYKAKAHTHTKKKTQPKHNQSYTHSHCSRKFPLPFSFCSRVNIFVQQPLLTRAAFFFCMFRCPYPVFLYQHPQPSTPPDAFHQLHTLTKMKEIIKKKETTADRYNLLQSSQFLFISIDPSSHSDTP
ncbi:uncharacterized protein TEOVI_000173800 [Trypanosoma equiperdum]|uniref:Uncharacterized protein n=1 Tax=Trypanosoma equiperdum TaxID=5694 RepID=A0A1G4ICZ8_TRYEQ|nr:hypothetical protein, conserved [Trypanosoma equiperdum]